MLSANIYAAVDTSYVVSLTKRENKGPDKTNEPDHGNRIPPRPIQCIISENEDLYISSVEISEILYFEIYDSAGLCLATFTNQEDFRTFIFANSGDRELRFITNDFILIGHISL